MKEWLYKVSGPLVQDSGALQLKEWLYKVSGPPVHDLRINSVELVVVQDFRTTTAEKVVAQGFRTARRGGRGNLVVHRGKLCHSLLQPGERLYGKFYTTS